MARKKQLQLTEGWAIYLRTSSDDNQAPERSQESQRRVIHEQLVASSGLPIIEEYADTYSGRSTDRANYQHMLADARERKFSHVAVFAIDRFGRNDVECGRAVDELNALGIAIKIAGYADLDISNASGRMIFGLMSSVARFESDRNGERTTEGMVTRLLQGGWPYKVPDGYINVEERAGSSDLNSGRYRRWVEQDPEQAPLWRLAWDLLLEDQMALKEICVELHNRGYRLRSGRSFVRINKAGRRAYATNALSRAFHNWFYAGWIDIDNDQTKIPPKSLRGKWEPIVSTEEFERGLAILTQRNHNPERKKKYFYLLRGLIYLENEFGKEEKLVCARPNANRPRGGVSYYCVPSSKHNFLCGRVDEQILDHLRAIQPDARLLPSLRKAYIEDLDRFVAKPKDEHAALESALQAVIDEETRALGLYATGKISEEAWDIKSREWRDRRLGIEEAMAQATSSYDEQLADLNAALKLIAKLGILYERLDQHTQRAVLKHVIERVVINLEGKIVKVDLRSPFAYLRDKAQSGGANFSRDAVNQETSDTSVTRSFDAPLGVPYPSYVERLSDSAKAVILYFESIAYPQRPEKRRFLAVS